MGIAVTVDNFEEEVLRSPVPVLLDFWADWCTPCKMIAPVLEEIAQEYSGRFKLCKIDVDAQGDLANQHGVVSIPTLVVYQDGKILRQQVGALPKPQIQALLGDLLT
jgi:thioredoxin 1